MANDILGQLGEAVVLLRADGDTLSEDLKREKDKLEKQLDGIGKNLTATGTALTVGVTAPILAMGTAAIAAGVMLDDAFDLIRVKTGETGDALVGLQTDFKAVFADVPDDAMLVANTLSTLNQRLGLTGEELQKRTEQILTMSRITKTDLTANVDGATKAFNAWNLSTIEQGRALDTVFKVSQQTGASVTTLLQTVAESQPIFGALNMTFDESVVLLGQLNKNGIDTSTTLAGLRNAIKEAAESGKPANEVLRQTLDTIQKLGPGTEATNLAVEVFGKKAGPALATAIGQGKLSIDELLASIQKSPETIKTAAEATDGFAEKLAVFRNKANAALEPLGTKLIEVGERALPLLLKLGEKVLGIVDAFSRLPEPAQNAILVMGGIASAIGPVVTLFGTNLPAAITATNTALMFLSANPIALAALAFAAGFVAVKVAADNSTDAIRRHIQAANDNKTIHDLFNKTTALTSAEQETLKAALERVEKQTYVNSKGLGSLSGYNTGLKLSSEELSQELDIALNPAMKRVRDAMEAAAAGTKNFGTSLDTTKPKVTAFAKEAEKIAALPLSNNPYDILKGMPGFGLGAAPPMPPQALPVVNQNPWEILEGMPTVALAPPPALMKRFGMALSDAFTGPGGFTSLLGPTVLQAITGGGSVTDSIGALAGQTIGKTLTASFGGVITDTLGKTLGTAVTGLLPGLGALAGPLISKGLGAVVGFVGGIFKGNTTKNAREDFATQMGFGNLDQLYRDLEKIGGKGAELSNIGKNVIGRGDTAANQKWMQDVLKFYDDVAAKKQKDLQDTADAQDRLQGALNKYGFTIEELGPKWRQQALNEQAQELILDYTALTASSIDVDTVIKRMGASIQEFITLALKTGSEVPEAMRPMLQKMVEMGTLTDENGNVITDLETSGIKFSKTMTEGFDAIVKKLDELIKKLTGELTDSLNNLPNPTVTVDVEYDVPPIPGTNRGRNPDTGEETYPEFSEGGVANFGAGTMAILHGPEAVIPLDRLERMMGGVGPAFDAKSLVAALKDAGFDRPNVNFAPKLEGALANEMYDFGRQMWPILIQILQNDGPTRSSLAGTIGVS